MTTTPTSVRAYEAANVAKEAFDAAHKAACHAASIAAIATYEPNAVRPAADAAVAAEKAWDVAWEACRAAADAAADAAYDAQEKACAASTEGVK